MNCKIVKVKLGVNDIRVQRINFFFLAKAYTAQGAIIKELRVKDVEAIPARVKSINMQK